MKKYICILLVLAIAVGLCSCGASNSKGIEITLENFDNYFNCETYVEFDAIRHGRPAYFDSWDYNVPDSYTRDIPTSYNDETISLFECDTITYGASCTGASTNFNYKDIKLTFKLSGYYYKYHIAHNWLRGLVIDKVTEQPLDSTFEIVCNISGYGEKSEVISLDYAFWCDTSTDGARIELVDVSGYITPA